MIGQGRPAVPDGGRFADLAPVFRHKPKGRSRTRPDAAYRTARTEVELRLFAEPELNDRDIVLKMLAMTLDGLDWANDGFSHGRKIAKEAARADRGLTISARL